MKTQIRNLLIALLIFPVVYIIYSLLPLGKELFVKGNADYYIPFWGGIILLHWLSFYVVFRMLRSEGKSWKDIGYNLSRKKTVILILSYFAVAFGVFAFTEMSLQYMSIDEVKLQSLQNFYPKTTLQRLLFIGVVFSAGFCEEFIYRGFIITKFHDIGLNRWVAIIPAGISFVFMHGIIGFYQFGFYFIPAIIFGVLFVLTKRLWPNIIIHLLFDLMAMMAIFQVME